MYSIANPSKWIRLPHLLHSITNSSSRSFLVLISFIEYVASSRSSGDKLALHFGQGKSPRPSMLVRSTLYSKSSLVLIFRFFFFSIFFSPPNFLLNLLPSKFSLQESAARDAVIFFGSSNFLLPNLLFCLLLVDDSVFCA